MLFRSQRDDQTQVGLQQVILGPASVGRDPLQIQAHALVELLAGVQEFLGEQAGLDALGELDLLLGVEEGDLADLLEVVLDRVGRGTCDGDGLHRLVGVVDVGDDEGLVLLGLAVMPPGADRADIRKIATAASIRLMSDLLGIESSTIVSWKKSD